MSISVEQVYGKSAAMVHRRIADETILVPIRRDVADLDAIYALQGVAPRIWELADGERSVREIVACLVEEYEVDPATAQSDIVDLLTQLEAIGALEARPA
jgi:hypothetical protein